MLKIFFSIVISFSRVNDHLPTRAPTLVRIIKEATPPSKVPTRRQPTASYNGLPEYWDKAIHPAAMMTPATAAVSSKSTTFTDGSELRITET